MSVIRIIRLRLSDVGSPHIISGFYCINILKYFEIGVGGLGYLIPCPGYTVKKNSFLG